MTSLYRKAGKRILDVILALAALVLFSPVMLLSGILVYLKLGSPILFRQQRPGFHGRPFTLYKFRTMRDAYDREGHPLPDDQRMTRFGSLLRALSLDELPELINVLKGEMSLVGPRPLLMEYLPRYSPQQARRHEVKPGITGWAQVRGRNALTWEEKLDFDVWYVDHIGFWLDVKIMFLTVKAVLKREGIHQSGHVTMSKFMGQE